MVVLVSTVATAAEKKAQMPSMAFLEYLAELEKTDKGWVGPADMLDQKTIEHNGVMTSPAEEKGSLPETQVPEQNQQNQTTPSPLNAKQEDKQ